MELLRQHVSRTCGRDLDITDPMIERYMQRRSRNQQVRGTNEGDNLYTYKCWYAHMLYALQQNGSIENEHDPIAYRIADSVCGFRLRIRQHMATSGRSDETAAEMAALLCTQQPVRHATQEAQKLKHVVSQLQQATQDARARNMFTEHASDAHVLTKRIRKKRAASTDDTL